MIGKIVIFNISMFTKGIPFLFQAGWQEKLPSWLDKNEQHFEKCVMGCPLKYQRRIIDHCAHQNVSPWHRRVGLMVHKERVRIPRIYLRMRGLKRSLTGFGVLSRI